MRKVLGFSALAVSALLVLTACSSGASTGSETSSTSMSSAGSETSSTSVSSAGSETSSASVAGAAAFSPKIHAMLPKRILDAGKIIGGASVWPPFQYMKEDGVTPTGFTYDLAAALSTVLGVPVEIKLTPAYSDIATGMQSGRIDLGFGPSGDTAELEKKFDWVDWYQEYVVFIVKKGTGHEIKGLSEACGLKVAVLASGLAEKVMKQQSDTCVKEGKPAVDVQSYPDGSTAALTVRSGRADAYFASRSNLSYYVSQSSDTLEITGTDEDNGFGHLNQGTFFKKDDSQLRDAWLAALNDLQSSGVISGIFAKWDLSKNEAKTFGLNLATK